MTAHVSGLPVEELLPAVLSGSGAFLILRLTAFGARLRQRRCEGDGRRTRAFR